MTQAEPIPDLQYGAGNWQDYINNWREKDAEYLQARTILRFATTTTRDSVLTTPGAGQFAWVNDAGDGTEMLTYRSKSGGWKKFQPLAQNLKHTEDATKVTMSHVNAGGKGLTFGANTPWGISIDTPFSVLGVLTADSTGVSIKTGDKTAKFTTDGVGLKIDQPVTATNLTLTGTGTVFSAVGKTASVGTIIADVGDIDNISMSGTLTGGKYTGTEATIGSVTLKNGQVVGTAGIIDQNGIFYGDGDSAIMRYRPTSGTYVPGSSYLRVYDNVIQAHGGVGSVLDIYTLMRVRENAANNQGEIRWVDSGGVTRGYIGPVVVSNTSQPAANWPNGTIWIDPS